jgi:hypothetical protein
MYVRFSPLIFRKGNIIFTDTEKKIQLFVKLTQTTKLKQQNTRQFLPYHFFYILFLYSLFYDLFVLSANHIP